MRFVYSHYFVSALRLSFGVLCVFVIGYFLTDSITSSVATIGSAYVSLIDRPAPIWPRVKEMLAGALLGAIAVGVTGLALNHSLALLLVMTVMAFFFSMLVVYGVRGATIGLACMTLAIITLPAGLTPSEVMHYSLVSLAGAMAYIVYSVVSGPLFQKREEQQCLSVALFATSQYLFARAHLYDNDVDINSGYQTLIASQAQMIASHQGARDAMLGHISAQSVQKSPLQLMLWNVGVDMTVLVDLVISSHTDYILLHQKLPKSKALLCMHDALVDMALSLERIAFAVNRKKLPNQSSPQHDSLQRLQSALQALKDDGFAQSEPETFAICTHINHRLNEMQQLVDRMLAQSLMPPQSEVLYPSFLVRSLGALMSSQSFSPILFVSNLRLDSAAFRYALRVSLAIALAMLAGMQLPDTGKHGYWIALTIIVIMKPAFSMTKNRNVNRLIGTLIGCALTFALLHLTSDPSILLPIFGLALVLCFVFIVTANYLIYSMFVSITVLLMLHAIMPGSAQLPTERALDTVIGSIIALACSFVLPWWESKSMPLLAVNAIRANQNLLRATLNTLRETQTDVLAWQKARHNMQMAFSNFSQGFKRMMAEPVSQQKYVEQYSNLVIQVHVMAAEIVNMLKQVKTNPEASQSVLVALEELSESLQMMRIAPEVQGLTLEATKPMADWSYALKQLQQSTQQVIAMSQEIGIVLNPHVTPTKNNNA